MNTPCEPCYPIGSVLYIEDNSANVALVEHLIARRGDLKFLSASTGTQGIEMACEHLPVAILVDINLPDISGYDVLKYLRSIPATAHIPVMALSADAYFRQIEQGIAAGFCQYLTKPFKIAELMEALETCLTIGAETTVRSPSAVYGATHNSNRLA
jgi:CheY-like chemotaxis protein